MSDSKNPEIVTGFDQNDAVEKRNSIKNRLRKVFILQSLYILLKGLIIGNLIAFAIIALEHYTGIIALDAESYYVDHVPCALNFWHFAAVDLGTLVLMTVMMTSYWSLKPSVARVTVCR